MVGATGNVGSALLRVLSRDSAVTSIVGIARRRPRLPVEKATWVQADVVTSDLASHFVGADVVVHLAWIIQPSHKAETLRRVNVEGSRRVFEAVARARVPSLVYASSVGVYSPGPKDPPVDETWPTDGVPSSFYSVHKAEVERLLDAFEQEHPSVRVVRMRPGLIFQREAGAEVRRLFAGPFLPNTLVRRRFIPVVPEVERLVFQVVHARDAAEAYRLAILSDASGAFNIAADPVLDPAQLASIFRARLVRVPPALVRGFVDLTWRMHLQPTSAGWVDLALQSPILDSTRAREELGWKPRYTSTAALEDLLSGIRDGVGLETPALSPRAGGFLRLREILSGVGGR